jgi:acyl-coenzyme A synthetase/AMP-(fatty) acid ligase
MLRNRDLIFDLLWSSPPDGRPWVVDHESPAVEVDNGQVSPRAIAHAAGQAATLFESQGTRAGDRCVMWLDQPLDIVVALAGLTAIGAVPILLSPALDIEMVGRILAPVPPVARVVTTGSRLASCSALRVSGRTDDWESLAEDARGLEPRRRSLPLPATAPYVVTHTSGTTGVNKLVEYSRGGADHNSYTQELPAMFMGLRGYAAAAFSPVHFRAVVGLLATLRRRIPLIIMGNHEPDSVGPILEKYQPTYLEAHPDTFIKWERLASAGSLASVRYFFSTFDVIHPRTIKTLLSGSRSRLAIFIEIYGQSEACAIAGRVHVKGFAGRLSDRRIARRLDGHVVGWRLPGHSRIRIVDEEGTTLGPGTEGRIQVRAKGRFSTYPNNLEAARDNLTVDDWWDTGDYGKKDQLGRLTLIDRQVERLTLAPSAIAIEDVLLDRMPWLQEAVVLERDHELIPVVATRSGAFDHARWRASVRDLTQIGQPIVMDERAIPRTATGKVQRASLAALVSDMGRADRRAASQGPVVETPYGGGS